MIRFRQSLATLTWDSGDGTPGDVDLDLAILYYYNVGNYKGWRLFDIISSHSGSQFESGVLKRYFENIIFGASSSAITVPYISGTSNNVTVKLVLSCPYGELIDNSNKKTFEWTYTLKLPWSTPPDYPAKITDCPQPSIYYCNGIKIVYSDMCPSMKFN